MSYAILFGKLQEHEIELGRMENQEEKENKPKSIALKAESREAMEEENPVEDENITLMVKRFVNFLQNDKPLIFVKIRNFFNKNEASILNQIFSYFECGKKGHMKAKCPNHAKKNSHKGKKEFK